MGLKLRSCLRFRVVDGPAMDAISITAEDFNVGEEYAQLCAETNDAGAVVFFTGLVRNMYPAADSQTDNDKIAAIELSHYPAMTQQRCEAILERAKSRFSYTSARLIHRVGRLQAGEQIVFVGVAAKHRAAAFEAAQYIMDHLKTEAPFWKKEIGTRGEQWLGVKPKDADAARRWITDEHLK